MEIRELYDSNRNKLGKTIQKGEKPLPGEFYLAVFIVIKEKKDDTFLIQKRSINKGGKWACTTGHPKVGETSFEGLLTEVKEELGIDLSKEKVLLYDTIIDDRHIVDYYYTEIDINISNINIQEEELTDIKMVNIDELKEILLQGEFFSTHIECINKFVNLFPMIKNNYQEINP